MPLDVVRNQATAPCNAVEPLDKIWRLLGAVPSEVEGQLQENKHKDKLLASAPCSAVGALDKMEVEGQLGENKHYGKMLAPRRAVPLDHWTRWRVKGSWEKNQPNGKRLASAPCSAVGRRPESSNRAVKCR